MKHKTTTTNTKTNNKKQVATPAATPTDGQQPKKRKRGGHNSACWVCQRDHRACDVSRPCKRCVTIGTADECLHPPPKKEARPRKRKFFIVTTETFAGPTSKSDNDGSSSPPPEQNDNVPSRQPGSPPTQTKINQFSGWQWQQVPSSQPASVFSGAQLRDTFPPITTRPKSSPTSSPLTSPSSSTIPSPLQEFERDQDKLLMTLLQEVQQLNETTGRLKQEQSLIGKQLSALQHPTCGDPACEEEESECFSHTRLLLTETFTPNYITNVHSSSSASRKLPMSDNYDYEPEDSSYLPYMDTRHLPVPRDYVHFAESTFIPFLMNDPSKPFAVYKPIITDKERFKHVFSAPLSADYPIGLHQLMYMTILFQSPSFSALLQLEPEEMTADRVSRLKRPCSPSLSIARSLGPQPPHVHVSPVHSHSGTIYETKDGRFLNANSRLQFFYDEEGQVSFFLMTIPSYQEVDKNKMRLLRSAGLVEVSRMGFTGKSKLPPPPPTTSSSTSMASIPTTPAMTTSSLPASPFYCGLPYSPSPVGFDFDGFLDYED